MIGNGCACTHTHTQFSVRRVWEFLQFKKKKNRNNSNTVSSSTTSRFITRSWMNNNRKGINENYIILSVIISFFPIFVLFIILIVICLIFFPFVFFFALSFCWRFLHHCSDRIRYIEWYVDISETLPISLNIYFYPFRRCHLFFVLCGASSLIFYALLRLIHNYFTIHTYIGTYMAFVTFCFVSISMANDDDGDDDDDYDGCNKFKNLNPSDNCSLCSQQHDSFMFFFALTIQDLSSEERKIRPQQYTKRNDGQQ